MAFPVVIVTSGGLAVTEAATGTPMTPTTSGLAVNVVASGGYPVVLVNDDGSAYSSGPVTLGQYDFTDTVQSGLAVTLAF